MEIVVVERHSSEPQTYATLEQLEAKSAWCFQVHQVRFVRSFLSRDGTRMICVYAAPDAEAVRQANRKAGLPFDSVWTAKEYLPSGHAP